MQRDIHDLLPDYVQGVLDDAARRVVEGALEGSESLRREAEELRTYYRALGGLPRHRAPRDFLTRVNAQIDKPTAVNRFSVLLLYPLKVKVPLELAGLAITAALIFLLYTPDQYRTAGKTQPEISETQSAVDKALRQEAEEEGVVGTSRLAPATGEAKTSADRAGAATAPRLGKTDDESLRVVRQHLARSVRKRDPAPVSMSRSTDSDEGGEFGIRTDRQRESQNSAALLRGAAQASPTPAALREEGNPEPRLEVVSDKSEEQTGSPATTPPAAKKRAMSSPVAASALSNERSRYDGEISSESPRSAQNQTHDNAVAGLVVMHLDAAASNQEMGGDESAFGKIEGLIRKHHGTFSLGRSQTDLREYRIELRTRRFDNLIDDLTLHGTLELGAIPRPEGGTIIFVLRVLGR